MKFYATDFGGLEVTEFNTKAEAAAFVLAKKGRSVLDVACCLECGGGLLHQVESHYTDHEFFYSCTNDHLCHSDGVPLTPEEIEYRGETIRAYEAEES